MVPCILRNFNGDITVYWPNDELINQENNWQINQ